MSTETGLHIFVNRRKFGEGDGIRPEMTGEQIAKLVDVPPGNAVVRIESAPDKREIGLHEVVRITNGEQFLVTRKVVEGGMGAAQVAMAHERVESELGIIRRAGLQQVEYIAGPRDLVLYRAVPTAGAAFGLPSETDVVVPIPDGYPAAPIDLAGLPMGSPLLPRLKGGTTAQGAVEADGRQWQLVSYHPHRGGGGPEWDQLRHGFHTYLDHLIAWLHRLN